MAGGWFLEPARHVRLGTRKALGYFVQTRGRGPQKAQAVLTEVFIETIVGSHVVVRNDSERSQLSFACLSPKSHFVTGQCHSRVLTLTQLPITHCPGAAPSSFGLGLSLVTQGPMWT